MRGPFRTLFPNAIGKTLREFLFGSACPRCNGGAHPRRWSRYDGTGSWRIHPTGYFPDTYETSYCGRNGWFSRHWFTTVVIVFVIGLSVCVGVNVALAADSPEKPDAWFCLMAKLHRAQFSTDKAAEDDARAQGASQATIAKAYRCKRKN